MTADQKPTTMPRSSRRITSLAVWFDAFVTNVDRTARNPNLLCWHKALYFIHGASLYFHHNWGDVDTMAQSRFALIRDHVLLPCASQIQAADAGLRNNLHRRIFSEVLALVPREWLTNEPADYVQYFERRLQSAAFVEKALRARAELV